MLSSVCLSSVVCAVLQKARLLIFSHLVIHYTVIILSYSSKSCSFLEIRQQQRFLLHSTCKSYTLSDQHLQHTVAQRGECSDTSDYSFSKESVQTYICFSSGFRAAQNHSADSQIISKPGVSVSQQPAGPVHTSTAENLYVFTTWCKLISYTSNVRVSVCGACVGMRGALMTTRTLGLPDYTCTIPSL